MPDNPLRLTLFGGFALADSSGEEVTISLRKGQGVLAYLALAAGQSASREHLAGVFWGGSTQQNARQSLRQLLFSLTRDLTAQDETGQSLSPLVIESQSVSLRPGAISVDVVQFRALAEAGDARSLDAALRLYTGELLDGSAINSEAFETWLNAERQQLAETVRTAVRSVIAHRRAQGQHYQAIAVCQTGLRLDPLNEALHRTLIEMYLENAMHSSALAQYRYCVGLLRSELGVEPDRETRRLYERILSRGDQRDSAPESPQAQEPAASEDQGAALFLEREALMSRLTARLLGEDPVAEHTLLQAARGFGKSELLKRLGAQLDDRGGPRVLRLHGCIQEQDLSLAPWMEVVGALSRRLNDGQGGESAIAELRRLMEASIDAKLEDAQPPHHLARALGSVLTELGERQGIVLLVDDAQALDPASLWLLGYCLRRAEALRLRAVVTWNGEGTGFDPAQALALQTAKVDVLDLPGLSGGAIRSVVKAALRNLGSTLAPDIAPEIEAIAEGNPMVAKELAWNALKASGQPGVAGGVTGGETLRAPAQVRRHLAERLEPLRSESRRILEALAVAAAPMSEAELAQVVPFKPDVLAAALRALAEAALVQEDGGARFRVLRAYERRAVLEAMSGVGRAAIHKAMVAMLKSGGVEDEQTSLRLAIHHEGARESGCAVDAILAAVRLARGRGAYRDARRHLQKAERAATVIPAGSAARTVLSVEIQLEHARLWELAQDDAKAADCLAAAAGEEVDLLPSSVLYRLLMARARNAAARGDAVEGHRQFRHAVMLAARQGRPIRPRAADRLLNQLHLIDCTPEAYARRLEETARTLNARGQRLAECEVTGALAVLLAAGGRFDEAGTKIAGALKLADEMGDEVLLAAALQWCGMIALWRGDFAGAEVDLLRAAKIAETRGDLLRLQMAGTLRATALLAQGEDGPGMDCLERARALAEEINDAEGSAMAAAAAAEFALRRGDTAAAHGSLQRILGDGTGFQRPWTLALGRRLLARTLLNDPAGSPVEAERAARHAVAEQEALGLKVDAARSLVVQARAYRAAGQASQAVETYADAARRLSLMGLAREASEAQTLAAALSVHTAGARDGPD